MGWLMLIVMLGLCAAWDAHTKTIPFLECLGPILVTLTIGQFIGWWELSWSGLMVGFLGAWVCDLPVGDRWAIGLTGALVGTVDIAVAQWGVFVGLAWVLNHPGHYRSFVGVPFFPWMAGGVVVVEVSRSLVEHLWDLW